MSEPDHVTERELLRPIQRRNIARGLPLLAAAGGLWWLLSYELEYRFNIQDDLAKIVSLLIVTLGVSLLSKRLGWDKYRGGPETERVRWLQRQALDRSMSKARKYWIFGFSLFFLAGVGDLFSGTTVLQPIMSLSFIIIMMLVTGIIQWKLPDAMDELAKSYYLTATRIAYLVTVSLCLAGLFVNTYWHNRLPTIITLSLLGGMLAHLISLAVLEARAAPGDD